jgi:uncharacterized protein YceK
MKALILVVMVMVLIGCTSLNYTTADGTSVTYTRFMTNADSIVAKVGTAKVEVNGSKIDAASLQAIVNILNGVTP